MSKTFTEFIDGYLPSKDAFWRRFTPFWVIFNWRLIYITLFVDSDNLNGLTKLDYLRDNRFWFDVKPDLGYVALIVLSGVVLPYILTKLYYKNWFQDFFFREIYENYNISSQNKLELLSSAIVLEDKARQKNKKLREDFKDEMTGENSQKGYFVSMVENWIVKFSGQKPHLSNANFTEADLKHFTESQWVESARGNVNKFVLTQKGSLFWGIIKDTV